MLKNIDKWFLDLRTKSKIMLGLSVPISFILMISVTILESIQHSAETADWVRHTHEVISEARELSKLIVDLETGERGYVITGEDHFLEPYNLARDTWKKVQKGLQIQRLDPEKSASLKKMFQGGFFAKHFKFLSISQNKAK